VRLSLGLQVFVMKAMVVDAVTKYYQKAFERSTQG